MRIGDIFLLDWNIQELYGWELVKRESYVQSIIDGIKEGRKFSEVPVIVDNERENTFFLDRSRVDQSGLGCIDGGHNRAIGHYLAKVELVCLVSNFGTVPHYFKPIKNIRLI